MSASMAGMVLGMTLADFDRRTSTIMVRLRAPGMSIGCR
jgi:hypothetical protein